MPSPLMLTDPALIIALLVGTGIAAQWLAARLNIPAIVLLLLIGFLAGPVFGIFDPDATFGDLLFPGVSVAVAIILFEGALTLHISDIKGAGAVVVRFITLGVAVTIGVVAIASHFALGLSWSLATLFGAIVSVTGPTVIVPLLRAVRPNDRVSQILKWEGILIDPIGAVLAVIAFEAMLAEITAGPGSNVLINLFVTIGLGAAAGALAGLGLGILLKRHLLPDFLTTVATLATVLMVHALANTLAHESGLVAVTVMGMVLANLKDVPTERILDFKESLSVLLISVLFIVLAGRIQIDTLTNLGPGLILVLAAILFVARPLSALLCTLGSEVTWPERGLLAWVAPKGIIAAAVSALFALRLQAEGLQNAALLVSLTFSTIVVTVVLQSLTARPLARLLGIAQPESTGVLIIGGNPLALAIGTALQKNGLAVVVADSSWEQIRKARMAGLRTFYGNPVSEQADRSLDLVGIGKLMALSWRPALNALACVRYRSDFGGGALFTVRREKAALDRESEPMAFDVRGDFLFAEEMTLEKLMERITSGYEIKVTGLTEDYSFADLLDKAGKESLLFAISPGGAVRPFSDRSNVKAAKGWRIGYLVPPEKSAAIKSQKGDERAPDVPVQPPADTQAAPKPPERLPD